MSAAAGKVNLPTYRHALVDEWIAGVPGLPERLAAGGTVADVAAGGGDAAALVATAFPQARVHAYDIVDGARDDLPGNAQFRQANASSMPDDGPFDLVYILDSFHHLGDPALVLAGIRRNLAPGGTVMIVEAGMSGQVDQDVADPFSRWSSTAAGSCTACRRASRPVGLTPTPTAVAGSRQRSPRPDSR